MSNTATIKTVIRCECGLNQWDRRHCRRCKRDLHPEIARAALVNARALEMDAGIERNVPRPVAVPGNESITEISRAIGHIVRQRRRPLMSQADLAREVGVSVTLLCLIEGGRANPSLRMVEALARALDMRASELMADAELIAGDLAIQQGAAWTLRFGPQRVTAAEMQERTA